MNNWDMRLPGAEMWGPYLEQSPVPPAAFAENPWEALRSFLPESLPTALHTAASWYAAVLTFLVLGAVILLRALLSFLIHFEMKGTHPPK